MYLVDYDNRFRPGGNGSDSLDLSGEETIRYFIEDVAALKYEKLAVSAIVQMVIYNDPRDGQEKNIIVLVGYSGQNATGNAVGAVLPCPPYCHGQDGALPVTGSKMPLTAALIYLNPEP